MNSACRVKRPNFFIVGAAKCGTTSLYAYLRQHPDVFMPRWKELSFFCDDPTPPLHKVKRPAFYKAVFAPAAYQTAIGEASTSYLYDPTAAAKIREKLGRVRIIIMLRDPVQMAYSLYNHQFRKEGEHLSSFTQALAVEAKRMADENFRRHCYGWHANYYYFHRGLYTGQVKRYLELFGQENVLIHLFDDLIENPLDVVRRTFRFLGVDESFEPDLAIHNKGGRLFDVPRFYSDYGLFLKTASFLFSKNLFRKLALIARKRGVRPAPPMAENVRRDLAERFHKDVGRLERLIDRDLSAWRDAG